MKSYWANTFYIIILASLGYFATDIYLPSLPAIALDFGVGEAEIQLSMVVYMLAFALTPLVFGPLSDHYGRKKIVLTGLCITLVATIGCYFAQSITPFLACRFVQGVGAGAVVIASRAMIPDLYEGHELAKQYSYMTTGMPLILSLAPLLGGFLQEYLSWHAVFLFLTGYVSAILLLSLRSQESLKTPRQRSFREVLSIYKELASNRRFILFGMGMTLPSVALFGYLTASPFLFQELIGLSPSEFGTLAVYIGIVITLASFVNTFLLLRWPIQRIIKLGFSLILLASLCMFGFHFAGILSKWSLLGPILIFFSCMPFALANSGAKAMSQISEHFGSAGALLAAMQFLFGSLGSFIFSSIPEVNTLPLAICIFSVACLVFWTFNMACRLEQKA